MPVLKKEQHELFAQALANGASKADAYWQAGYKAKTVESASTAGGRLLKNVEVANRVAELQREAAMKADITREWLLEQGKAILAAAMNDSSHAASVAALKELGVLSGERVEKSDNTQRHNLGNMSDDELKRIAGLSGS